MADRWLSYEEAGELFGLSAEAIRKRARRLGWRVQPGNDGKARVLVPDGAGLQPDGRGGRPGQPAGHSDGHADELLMELRRRAETAEARLEELTGQLVEQRERAAKAEGEAAARREGETRERERAERAEAARQAADAARQAMEATRDAALAELAGWTAGGPLARAWRAFTSRRGRP